VYKNFIFVVFCQSRNSKHQELILNKMQKLKQQRTDGGAHGKQGKQSAVERVFGSKQLMTAVMHFVARSGFQHARSGTVRTNRILHIVCKQPVFQQVIDNRRDGNEAELKAKRQSQLGLGDTKTLMKPYPKTIDAKMVRSIIECQDILRELHLTHLNIEPLVSVVHTCSFPRLEVLSLLWYQLTLPHNEFALPADVIILQDYFKAESKLGKQLLTWIKSLLNREINPIRFINLDGTGLPNLYREETSPKIDDIEFDWRICDWDHRRRVCCPGNSSCSYLELIPCSGDCDKLIFYRRKDIEHIKQPHTCLNLKQRACVCTVPVVHGACITCHKRYCKPCTTRKNITFVAVCEVCHDDDERWMMCQDCLQRNYDGSIDRMIEALIWSKCANPGCNKGFCMTHTVQCMSCNKVYCKTCISTTTAATTCNFCHMKS
jgi:hypothetical protein